jgi:hypothetical protein
VSADQPSPVDRALDVLVYAPLGAGLWLRDLAPSLLETIVARGRAEVDRRQEQAQTRITTARSMGQVAIAFGVPELRKRAGRQLDQVRERADRVVETIAPPRTNGATGTPAPRTAGHATVQPAGVETAAGDAPSPKASAATATKPSQSKASATATATTPTTAANRSESSAHLPIPGYDALSASQVVERLAGLGADELVAVREYERAHRNRRTILGKIDQLSA